MNNILQIPLNKIRQEGNYKELLEALERGFNKFNIDFYLVGATAIKHKLTLFHLESWREKVSSQSRVLE